MCFLPILERYMIAVVNSDEKNDLEINPLGLRPWRSLAQVAKKISIPETHFFTKFSAKTHQWLASENEIFISKMEQGNLGPMRANTKPNRTSVGLREGRFWLRIPKTWNPCSEKIILLQIFRFIAKSLMAGLVKIFGIRYFPPGPRSVSKPPDLFEKSQI